ncbi:putative transcriptional regulatory protein [Colletotrichum spinosum]|uniref:Putative transcriptional regulatory protein n=1 Tax=Colletotrichum spinosum TaxID=1347390 RepID=A0A4R8Q583_9PEZI|nr:putative transcriptional regulatory protein [Colletotrichum spinosum]
MRSSLSCESCRRSKIKCVNSGSPPCRKCEKSGRSDCQLSRPVVNSTGRAVKRARTQHHASGDGFDASLPSSCEREGEPSQQLHLSAPQSRGPATPSQGSGGPEHRHGHRREEEDDDDDDGQRGGMDRHLQGLPKDLVFVALEAFWRKFPELRIIHPSSFMQAFRPSSTRESKALLATVLAMIKTQNPDSDRLRTHVLYASDRYASYASDVLAACILQQPDVKVIQALLILTLYEWGTRNFHKAWMHCGIAIRMMQLLHSSRVAPFPLEIPHRSEPNEITIAIETRTFWACFVMDCMVSSGTYNPRVLPKPEMTKLNVPRPPTSTEFALGSGSIVPNQPEQAEHVQTPGGTQTSVYLDLDQSFGIMADGFDMYSEVMAFVFNDGRKAPGMCQPEKCPWVPTSPVACWRRRLQQWRNKQHHRLHYPENSVVAHATLGYGESFVYLNLLYYQSIMMLHREYFPFLPVLESSPKGPIDPPLLEAEAPPGWWEESARELFGAAEHLGSILHEASECGVAVMTPFAGFCAFSSCFVNLYGFRFPRITVGYAPRAEELMNTSIEYLRSFRQVWDLGDGWASNPPPSPNHSRKVRRVFPPLTDSETQLKTIQNGSLMYQRITSDNQKYRGLSRFNFNVLHQSVHEFRVVDRSAQHLEEIDNAERSAMNSPGAGPGGADRPAQITTTTGFVAQAPADSSGSMDDQGLWPNWWSMLEDVNMDTADMFNLGWQERQQVPE